MPYLAPELLSGRGSYSKATDIYAFGIIMWEISSEEKPFGELEHDVSLALSISKGLRPTITEDTPLFYRDLMEKCWHADPDKRPNAQEIIDLTLMWSNYLTQEVKDQLDKAEEIRQRKAEKKEQILHPRAVYKSRSMAHITHGKLLFPFQIKIEQYKLIESFL